MPLPNVVGIDLASSSEYGARRYNRAGLATLAPDLTVLRLEAGPFDDDCIAAFVAETEAGVVASACGGLTDAGEHLPDQHVDDACATDGRLHQDLPRGLSDHLTDDR